MFVRDMPHTRLRIYTSPANREEARSAHATARRQPKGGWGAERSAATGASREQSKVRGAGAAILPMPAGRRCSLV